MTFEETTIVALGMVVQHGMLPLVSGIVAAAFANGRPVIASRVGGLPDFVRHGESGLVVPPGDAAALSQAMGSCTADFALVAKLRSGAVQTSATAFDWNACKHRNSDVIARVASVFPKTSLQTRGLLV